MNTIKVNPPLINIIDDDEDWHSEIINVLMKKGVKREQINITSDPEQFRKRIISSEINLYGIDHTLPGADGLTLVKEVKNKNRDSYVIIVTGQEDYRIVAKYLREGADDYVDKNQKDENYLQEFAEAVLRGLERAEKRTKEQLFMKEMMKRQEETRELIKKLKPG